jgi:hypothetical protein
MDAIFVDRLKNGIPGAEPDLFADVAEPDQRVVHNGPATIC